MRKHLWGGAGLAVVAAVVALLIYGRATRSEAAPGAGTVRVTRRDIGLVVKATGVIRPSVGAEVSVGSRVSGVVRHLYVQIGDTVRRGELLAELDDRDLVARRDEAAAALGQAEVDLSYARTDRQRRRALYAAGAIARSDLDLAERAHDVAEHQVAGARANLAYGMAQLGYARITAPIDGIVDSVSTQEGETVAASFAAPTFVTLLDPSRLEVWAYVDETDIGRIRVGQPAHFTVDTYGDEAFAGRVSTVHPRAEIRDNVVDYVAVVRFQAPPGRVLRPEMTTTVRIPIDVQAGVLSLPIRALRWQGGRPYVLLARGNGSERRWVTTGTRDDVYAEIVTGVHEGDVVLVGGNGLDGARGAPEGANP
jgi:RND family efflux transporter MFP subunit